MKPAFLLFVCISFLLLSGSSSSCLPVSLQSSHTLFNAFSGGNQQSHSFSHSKNTVVGSTNSSGSEYGFPNAIEPEDNDDDHKLIVRVLEWGNSFFQLIQTHLSHHLHNCGKGRLPACPHFGLLASDKFITYRAIRI